MVTYYRKIVFYDLKEGEKMLIIKQKRKEFNYTQRQLAKILDINWTTISKWEHGIAYPKFSTLLKLAEVFECSIDDLVKKEDMLLSSAGSQ